MTDTVERLARARAVAWATLVPVFDHAIALAREAEHQAQRAENEAQCSVRPAYAPLVSMLADAAPALAAVVDVDLWCGARSPSGAECNMIAGHVVDRHISHEGERWV